MGGAAGRGGCGEVGLADREEVVAQRVNVGVLMEGD